MEQVLIVILIFLVAGLGAAFFVMLKKLNALQSDGKSSELHNSMLELMKMTQAELQSTRREMQESLARNSTGMQRQMGESNRAVNERLDKAAQVIAGVSTELGKMQEVGRSMKDLQDFLRSPKLRGNIGEQVLKDLMEQYFSRDHIDFQYRFNEGQMVDAIIKTDKGIIPIDSKFPLENFQKMMQAANEEEHAGHLREFTKDVKKHISDIAKKYIIPSEGTVDFAVMYIPSEAVYYEIIRHDDFDLNNYGYERKVFPVSPNSFYYFMKVIMIGLEGKRIESATQKILELLAAIKTDNDKFSQAVGVATTHVTNAKNAMDRVNNDYSRLSGKIDQVKLLK